VNVFRPSGNGKIGRAGRYADFLVTNLFHFSRFISRKEFSEANVHFSFVKLAEASNGPRIPMNTSRPHFASTV